MSLDCKPGIILNLFLVSFVLVASGGCVAKNKTPFPSVCLDTEPIKWANVLAVKNVDDFFESNAKNATNVDPLENSAVHVGKVSLETQQSFLKGSPMGLVLTADKRVEPDSDGFSHWRMETVNNPSIPRDWDNYNYLSFWVYMEGAEAVSFNVLFELKEKIKVAGRNIRPFVFTEKNIESGKWTRVFLNFTHVPREQRFKLKNFRFYVYAIGREPDSASSHVRVYMDKFQLLNIVPRKLEGWEPDPALITVNQLGYPCFAVKHAYMNVSTVKDGEAFEVVDLNNNEAVFKGKINLLENGRVPYAVANFSDLVKPGRYQLVCGKLCSYPFQIGDKLYEDLLEDSLNYISGSRSGTATSLHGASHLDDGIFNGQKIDIAGGYYDACDVRRYGGNSCIVAESCLNAVEFGALPPRLSRRILEEARWACFSHHKILNGIGFIPRAIQEESKKPELNKNNCFSDNLSGTSDDREFSDEKASPADVHWLYAKAAAQLAFLLSERKAYDAKDALKRAEWVWHLFSQPNYWKEKKIGGNKGAHVTALKAQTALYLYRVTGSDAYLNATAKEGARLLSAQNRSAYVDAPFSIAGNFTCGADYHHAVLHKERGLAALADLCQFFPGDAEKKKYREALEFSSKNMIKPLDRWCRLYSLPFLFFPEPGGSLKNKRNDIGSRGGSYIIRPLLNYAYAQARVAQVLNDYELEDLVVREIAWCLGVNPFAVSFVWEVGSEPQRQCHAVHGVPQGTLFGGAIVNAKGEPFYLRDDKSIGCVGVEVHIPRQARFLQALALIAGPGKVEGKIEKDNAPWRGEIKIMDRSNALLRTFEILDGGFGPITLYPGQYKILAGDKAIPFDVVSACRQTLKIKL